MKKVFRNGAAVLLMAAAIVLIGCDTPTNTVERDLTNPTGVTWIEGSGPKNLTATSFAGAIYVGWDPDPNYDTTTPYAVYRRSEKDGTVVSLGTITQSTTGTLANPTGMYVKDVASSSANALVNGAAYTYGVILTVNPAYVANNGPEGTSYTPNTGTLSGLSWSNTVTAKIPRAGTKVTAPTNVKAEKVTLTDRSEYILVTWDEPAWADGDSPVAGSYTAEVNYGGDEGLALTSTDFQTAIDSGSGFAIYPFVGGLNTVQVWGNQTTSWPSSGSDYWDYYLPSDPVKVTLDAETSRLTNTLGFSIVIAGDAVKATQLTLTWNKIKLDGSTGVEAEYKLYRARVSDLPASPSGKFEGNWTAVDTTAKTVDPNNADKYLFTDTGLTANTRYVYLLGASIGNATATPAISAIQRTKDIDPVVLSELSVSSVLKTANTISTPLDESMYQFNIKFKTEAGASYTVYARTYGGPNQETVNPATGKDYDWGTYSPVATIGSNGTVSGVGVTGHVVDGFVNVYFTPTAQRQRYGFAVKGTKDGSSPSEIFYNSSGEAASGTRTWISAKSAAITPSASWAGKADNGNDYYYVNLPSGLLTGEKIEIWGTKTTATMVNGVTTYSTAVNSTLLKTINPGDVYTTTITGLSPASNSYYFSVGGSYDSSTNNVTVTVADWQYVIVAK